MLACQGRRLGAQCRGEYGIGNLAYAIGVGNQVVVVTGDQSDTHAAHLRVTPGRTLGPGIVGSGIFGTGIVGNCVGRPGAVRTVEFDEHDESTESVSNPGGQ